MARSSDPRVIIVVGSPDGLSYRCLETYQTMKKRLFNESRFMEFTTPTKTKIILAKDAIVSMSDYEAFMEKAKELKEEVERQNEGSGREGVKEPGGAGSADMEAGGEA